MYTLHIVNNGKEQKIAETLLAPTPPQLELPTEDSSQKEIKLLIEQFSRDPKIIDGSTAKIRFRVFAAEKDLRSLKEFGVYLRERMKAAVVRSPVLKATFYILPPDQDRDIKNRGLAGILTDCSRGQREEGNMASSSNSSSNRIPTSGKDNGDKSKSECRNSDGGSSSGKKKTNHNDNAFI